jgi:hypothetical protein
MDFWVRAATIVLVVIGAIVTTLVSLGWLHVEERYGATPFPERRLRLFNRITLWKWNA